MRTFEQLLAPLTAEAFLADHWQKKTAHVQRNDATFYGPCLTIEMLDDLLSGCALPSDNVDLGQYSVGIPKDEYTDGKHIIPEKVLQHHLAGNTVILRSVHLWLPTLRELCHRVGTYFHAPVQANVYLTPAHTKSAYPHWDAHDIFVLQIAGKKRWTLHETAMENPLYSYQFDRDKHPVGSITGEITLRPGDLAYLPRGFAHDPSAEDYSVHVSLGVKIKTWANVLTTALHEQIQRSSQLREAVPICPGQDRFDTDACVEAFARLGASEIFSASAVDAQISALSRDLAIENPPSVAGRLTRFAHANALSDTSHLQVAGRLTLDSSASPRWDAVWNGMRLHVPDRAVAAFRFLADHPDLRLAELPADNDFDRLAIAQKLVEDGFLRARTPSGSTAIG